MSHAETCNWKSNKRFATLWFVRQPIWSGSWQRQTSVFGFVSSHTKSNVLTWIHLHSFDTFYTDSDSNTVVTCTLSSRHHTVSNMQDCLMQLLQLIQFSTAQSFSVLLTNKIIDSDVILNQDSIDGYERWVLIWVPSTRMALVICLLLAQACQSA